MSQLGYKSIIDKIQRIKAGRAQTITQLAVSFDLDLAGNYRAGELIEFYELYQQHCAQFLQTYIGSMQELGILFEVANDILVHLQSLENNSLQSAQITQVTRDFLTLPVKILASNRSPQDSSERAHNNWAKLMMGQVLFIINTQNLNLLDYEQHCLEMTSLPILQRNYELCALDKNIKINHSEIEWEIPIFAWLVSTNSALSIPTYMELGSSGAQKVQLILNHIKSTRSDSAQQFIELIYKKKIEERVFFAELKSFFKTNPIEKSLNNKNLTMLYRLYETLSIKFELEQHTPLALENTKSRTLKL